MKLSVTNIVKLLQVKGVGRAKIFKIDRLLSFNPANSAELADALLESAFELNVPPLSRQDALKAFDIGESLLEKSGELE
jgi:hypothetical protein